MRETAEKCMQYDVIDYNYITINMYTQNSLSVQGFRLVIYVIHVHYLGGGQISRMPRKSV